MKDIVNRAYQNIDMQNILKMREEFQTTGILVLEDFLTENTLEWLQLEAETLYPQTYRSSTSYNPFVESVWNVPSERLKNIEFITQKECICYDEIPSSSALKQLYNGKEFQELICWILGIENIYPYADALSGINVNYYNVWDSLEWHYDNCNFTITILIKKPKRWWIYEYFPNQRYDANGKENYSQVEQMIDGSLQPERIDLREATLVLFRGTESLHRVTSIEEGQRILVTFCYNSQPGVSLSETSRMTFFGRLN